MLPYLTDLARRHARRNPMAILPAWLSVLPWCAAAVLAGTVVEGQGLRGVVVDAEGRGIEGASVYVETDPARPRDKVSAHTDGSGAFEIDDFAPARVFLRVAHPGFAPAIVPEVAAPAGEPRRPLRITLLRGARIEGVVRHRDGRPFTAGRIVVQASGAAAAYAPPEPIAPDESGAFALDHVLPGTARVYALAFTPGRGPREAASLATLSPIGTATADLRDGETTTVEMALRDVVVSGRVTRGGQGQGGVRVRLSGPPESVSFPGMTAGPAAAGPPMLSGLTREDGSYDVVAFGPGPARVSLVDAATGGGLAVRSISIPDADHFALDLEVTEARVAGIVVRQEDGTPLPDVLLTLARVGGDAAPPARVRSAPDGRFAIGAEPGEYRLTAEVLGRVPVARTVSLALDGLTDLRLEMSRGKAITGRLVDESGHPVAGRAVFAFGEEGFDRALTRRDGTFRIEGLGDRPYALSAGAPLVGFALRPGVRPGPEPVPLALRPGGRIALRVLSSDGLPVARAFTAVIAIDGARVDPSLCAGPPTDDDGRTTIGAPAGTVTVVVQSEAGGAAHNVAVHAGQTAALELRLQPPPR